MLLFLCPGTFIEAKMLIFICLFLALSIDFSPTVGAGVSAVGHRAQTSVFPGRARRPLMAQAVRAHRAAVRGEGAAGTRPLAQAFTCRERGRDIEREAVRKLG